MRELEAEVGDAISHLSSLGGRDEIRYPREVTQVLWDVWDVCL